MTLQYVIREGEGPHPEPLDNPLTVTDESREQAVAQAAAAHMRRHYPPCQTVLLTVYHWLSTDPLWPNGRPFRVTATKLTARIERNRTVDRKDLKP